MDGVMVWQWQGPTALAAVPERRRVARMDEALRTAASSTRISNDTAPKGAPPGQRRSPFPLISAA
jgi:hypothetical protein